jgi:uncharacterized repeat protein (TIGR01451 family)
MNLIKSPLIFTLLVSAGILVGSGMPTVAGERSLRGHVPTVISHLVAKGRLSAQTNLTLAIGLPLRNQDALTNLIREIYDPASPKYHQYLTPEEFTAQFGPTEADYQKVIDYAQTNGLTVVGRHSNRMLVDVKGKSSAVEKTFNVKMNTYKHPKESRDFFAPDTEPSLGTNIPVLCVQGLSDYQKPRPLLQKMPAGRITPGLGSSPGGGYMGQDFRNAYLPGSTLNGSGQIVGLVQFDGYLASDIATYASIAGLPNVPLQNVLLNGFNGFPGLNNSEVCLDIEMVMSMAPGISKIVVFEGYNPNDILSSMAASNQIKQLSASWGYPTDATTEQIYKQFALQGQTFLNASGDGDAWVGPIPYGSCESPNITIVGGTTLTMNGTGASYASEMAWNWGFVGSYNWNPDGYVGTSGGISTTVPIPSWQQGISMTNNHGSTTFRNVPDVALTGDNAFVVYDGGARGLFGGTSVAAPLWAGFMALVNQQAAINGKAPIGFLAPLAFAIAKTANYTNCFHDTVLGDNTWDLSLTNFFAVPGYDLCTGVGTPNGTTLINALIGVAPTHISPPLPPYGSTLSVLNGGNPNGTWNLFVADDSPFDSGVISNGWLLTLTTATPVGYAADVAVSMTVVSSNAIIGGNMVYLVGVTNYGPSTASNVIASDSLPFNGTYVSANVTKGSVTHSGSSLSWSVGTLATNTGALMTLTLQANSSGNALNSVFVNTDTPDPNPDDDFAAAVVTVASVSTPPQLSAVLVGGSGAFQLSVTNGTGSVIIQASTNLLTWVPVYTNTPPFTFSDANKTNYSRRFYRAVLGP